MSAYENGRKAGIDTMRNAASYYMSNSDDVLKLLGSTGNAYRPKDELLEHPWNWNAANWRWFLYNSGK